MKFQAYLSKYFGKMYKKTFYRIFLCLLGFLSLIPAAVVYRNKKRGYDKFLKEATSHFDISGLESELMQEELLLLKNKNDYFGVAMSEKDLAAVAGKEARRAAAARIDYETNRLARGDNSKKPSFSETFAEMIRSRPFLIYSLIFSFPMYMLLLIYSNPYTKYILERLIMLVFVLAGVVTLTFSIIYVSPMDPAVNILGQTATPENIAAFNESYGLDKPYLSQLGSSLRKLFTLDLGRTFQGKEDIAAAIGRKFPITMQLALFSFLICLAIGIPAGIVSAIKQYSSLDYLLMFFALLGLSIPGFWLGLVLILNFSIRLQILPASFIVGNSLSLLMPAVVLGTTLSANIARMTRSSVLEVKNQDFISTARAKGLPERTVIFRHMLGNAVIPIITIAGIQIGGLMAGSMVTEKVFNINGIGSYVVDKQFVPDHPAVLAGVVYFSVVVSIANLVVDLLYSFLDPRIKAKMKSY